MAAVDYFLKIDGIAGESTDEAHKNEFEIQDFSFGVENPTTIGSATGGAGAGKVRFNPFTITKATDSGSPKLMLSCASGQHIKQAVLVARKAGENPKEFLKITLSDVLVSSYQTSGKNPGPPDIITAPVDAVFVAPNQGIIGPELPEDVVGLSFASAQFTEGPQQHIAVTPTGAGTLAFDPKTGLVTFYPPDPGAPASLTVGSVNGGIQRGVQEFDIAILIGLLTAPFSTAHLRLAITEIREAAITPGIANIASVSAAKNPGPPQFDVLLYTPADGVIDAGDLTRPGKRIGTLVVDPNADPASANIDLTDLVRRRRLEAFGIRLQLHGLGLPDPFESDDEESGANADSLLGDDRQKAEDQEGRTPRLDASATFSLELALDTA